MIRPALLLALVVGGCSAPDGHFPQDNFQVTGEMRLAALEGASVGAMLDSLNYIEAWHVDKGTGIAQSLNPGIENSAIDLIEAELGCKLPRELRSLWRWKNGHPDAPTAHWLVWYHQLLPSEQALKDYRYLRSEPVLEWHQTWVPVMFFQEEWYFVECAKETVEASPLMYYFIESGPREAYRSLTTYFGTAKEVMENGSVYVEGEGSEMHVDLEGLAAAHAKHNPGLTFPYFVPE